MRLTPGQVRDVVDVPVETFRHWRGALTCLQGKNGHAPCFTMGDALGFAVVRQLVDHIGMRISAVAAVGGPLFDVCNMTSWHVLEDSYLLIDITGAHVDRVHVLPAQPATEVAVVVGLRPLVEKLRGQLLPGELDTQTSLPFPPVHLPKRRSA